MFQSIQRASKRVCSPNTKIGLALLKKLKIDEEKDINGFTLIELIVVVMIIGILSSIAVPQFLSSADKAKQREASLLVGSYLKAAQSYYTEYSSVPVNAGGLKNYVTVTQCSAGRGGAVACKSATPSLVGDTASSWYSQSGNYRIQMERNPQRFRLIAYPNGSGYDVAGYAVKGCFNPLTGGSKVYENSGTNEQGVRRTGGYNNC